MMRIGKFIAAGSFLILSWAWCSATNALPVVVKGGGAGLGFETCKANVDSLGNVRIPAAANYFVGSTTVTLATHTHSVLTDGDGLSGGTYNGGTARTWAVAVGSSPTTGLYINSDTVSAIPTLMSGALFDSRFVNGDDNDFGTSATGLTYLLLDGTRAMTGTLNAAKGVTATTVTVSSMSSAGFVKNSVTGVLSGGNSIVWGDLPFDSDDHVTSAGAYTDEKAQDAVDALIQDTAELTWTYNDGANTLTPAIASTLARDTELHSAVTLSTDVDSFLGLSGQQLTVDNWGANGFLVGPVTGVPAAPTLRAMHDNDIPAAITRDAEWDTAAEINAATTDADFLTAVPDPIVPADGTQNITGKALITDSLNLAYSATALPTRSFIVYNSYDAAARYSFLSLVNLYGGVSSIANIGLVTTAYYTGDLVFHFRTGAATYAEWLRLSSDGTAEFNGFIRTDSGTNGTPGVAGAAGTIYAELAIEDDGVLNVAGDTVLGSKITQYNGVSTEGHGLAAIVDDVALTAQAADIASSNFTNAGTAGTYRVNYYLVCTTADVTAGTISASFTWNDGTARTLTSATVNLISTNYTSGIAFVRLASGSVAYSVTAVGPYNNARYALYITVERLS